MRIMTIFGTRPEAIKLAPIVQLLNKEKIDNSVVVTGQHREMLDQVLKVFNIKPDHDLNIMQPNQTLVDITVKVLQETDRIIRKENPDVVIVQGDTTSAFVAGLVAFYHKVRVVHVEAGLRTNNKYNPFPEEINRRLLTHLADLHFAPTERAREYLVCEDIKPEHIFVTGNTVIDALLWVADQDIAFANKELTKIDYKKDIILLTTHRRENLEGGMDQIFSAVNEITKENPSVEVVFPVHLNPVIKNLADEYLADNKQVHLCDPLSYTDMVKVMKACKLVLTDSGGVQEEAPALGKPVLVLRETTERPEGIEAGTAKLVGLESKDIIKATNELLSDSSSYQKMAKSVNPYGDGRAAQEIVKTLVEQYS